MISTQQSRLIVIKVAMQLRPLHVTSFVELNAKAMELIADMASKLGLEVTSAEVQSLAWNVISKLSLSADIGVSVTSSSVRNDYWLDELNIDFQYFDRFIKYLKLKKDWIDTTALDKDSRSIIQMLGNPKTDNGNHRRGLLIGDVQSGKTASYTAIMNRAVDVGYDVIVLLAGSLENLRIQTQKRIDKELVGYTLDVEGDGKSMVTTGVGDFPIKQHLQVQTTTKKDFTKIVRNRIGSKIEQRTLLYIAKKNVTSLNLIHSSLVEDNEDLVGDDGKLKASILIIDDEADNASINTKKNTNLDPTKINGGIRKLLNSFSNTAYLAVTATPFANIYIDDTTDSEMYGDDLFPSDFIHLLDRPMAYTGAYKLFGDFVDKDKPFNYRSCLIPVYEDEIPENSYVFKHKKEEVEIGAFDSFPDSLQDSIRYFLLVQYLMDFIPSLKSKHRTMMINVSRFTVVQNEIADSIDDWLKQKLIPNVFQWHNDPEKAENANSGEFHELKKIWDEFGLELISGRKWEEICPGLYESICSVRISIENMTSHAKEFGRLNYENYPDGDRVISVGGQCLSRGLTLENLVVSYFYRNSAAYDTLLQMGRWFGYRDSYLQYFRIWMADESILWYRLISEACEDLRIQINKMNDLKMEPREFGLMVRRHPYSGLIITARSKMRNAKAGNRHPVSLDGRLIESPRLWKSHDANRKNNELIRDFLLTVSEQEEDSKGNIILKNINKSDVVPVIGCFDSATLSIGFKVCQLSDYVLNNCGDVWDVAIVHGTGNRTKVIQVGNKEYQITLVERKYKFDNMLQDGKPFIRINDHHVRIGAGDVTKIALSPKQLEELEKRYRQESREKTWEQISGTASVYLEAYDENGTDYRRPLLLLYPLALTDMDTGEAFDGQNVLTWGIGIGFPGARSDNGKRYFEYWMNPVAIREGIGLDFDQEEDDDVDELQSE